MTLPEAVSSSTTRWDRTEVAAFSAGTGVAFGVSGALIGTMIAPGLGTVVGAIIGIAVGIIFGIVTSTRHNNSDWNSKKAPVAPPLIVETQGQRKKPLPSSVIQQNRT